MSNKDIRKIIGNNVRLLRLRLKISQEELAFRAGLHRTYVGGVERGERNPSILTIAKIAKALDVNPRELINGND
jgi:transcriptional regulator with XRE-family HTH domain